MSSAIVDEVLNTPPTDLSETRLQQAKRHKAEVSQLQEAAHANNQSFAPAYTEVIATAPPVDETL